MLIKMVFQILLKYMIYGHNIKEIQNSNENVSFIGPYYDIILSKYYIITGNIGFCQSYDYDENNIYHKYIDDNNNYIITNIIIKNDNEKIKLFTTSDDGIIRIFNLHSGLLLNKIRMINNIIFGMCLWNDNYLFIGCGDGSIKIIEIKKWIIVKSLDGGHFNTVITIKKIFHPKYGNCLVTQNCLESQIKLWTNDI